MCGSTHTAACFTAPLQYTQHFTAPLQYTQHFTAPLQYTQHYTAPLQYTQHFTAPLQYTQHFTAPLQYTQHFIRDQIWDTVASVNLRRYNQLNKNRKIKNGISSIPRIKTLIITYLQMLMVLLFSRFLIPCMS